MVFYSQTFKKDELIRMIEEEIKEKGYAVVRRKEARQAFGSKRYIYELLQRYKILEDGNWLILVRKDDKRF